MALAAASSAEPITQDGPETERLRFLRHAAPPNIRPSFLLLLSLLHPYEQAKPGSRGSLSSESRTWGLGMRGQRAMGRSPATEQCMKHRGQTTSVQGIREVEKKQKAHHAASCHPLPAPSAGQGSLQHPTHSCCSCDPWSWQQKGYLRAAKGMGAKIAGHLPAPDAGRDDALQP